MPNPKHAATEYRPLIEDPWWANPWPLAAIAAAIALTVAAAVVGVFLLVQDDPPPPLVSLGGAGQVVGGENLSLRGEALNVQGVLQVVSPSVVSIETNVENFRGVFGGAGSGIVLDDQGLVLTNAHVVEDADELTVVFHDGTRAPGRVVSSIVDEDVALVQADGVTDTAPAMLGASQALLVGDQVLAIGNALGLGGDPTVTLGILSAKGRELEAGRLRFDNLLQTDAAINPGNSGGPLVNAAGQVVGINTAIIEGSQNVGFAIAIESVEPFLAGYLGGDAGLTPETAWFGASGKPTSVLEDREATQAQILNEGVYVVDVFDGSAADRAGIEPGDVITAIDGATVIDPVDIARIVRSHDPGDTIEVTFERQGEQHTELVSLGSRADAGN